MSIYETAVRESVCFPGRLFFGKSDILHLYVIGLFREDHFLQQMVGTGKFVDCEQDVADV